MPEAKAAAAEATEKVKATKVGTVVKAAMDKTVTVLVDSLLQHTTYKKSCGAARNS